MRRLWLAGWALTAALIVGVVAFPVWGVWVGDWRGLIGLVLLIPAIAAGTGMAAWTGDYPPERPLPRDARKRLREEDARIRVDAEIRRMEKEAGL